MSKFCCVFGTGGTTGPLAGLFPATVRFTWEVTPRSIAITGWRTVDAAIVTAAKVTAATATELQAIGWFPERFASRAEKEII